MSRPTDRGTGFDSQLPGVGRPTSACNVRANLAEAINTSDVLVLPGVTDALGARLVENVGFSSVYASGAGIANAEFGLPDIGLTSFGEMQTEVARIIDATNLPVIVDIDTGYGGPLNAMRTVRHLERLGAAGVQVEDQEMPKSCGHFLEHRLIPLEHMCSKISAMRSTREDKGMVIIARTDARGVEGLDPALERAKRYRDAGADWLFVEAPRTVEELSRVGDELAGSPLVVNVVEGGLTPELSVAEYIELGFSVVMFANYLMRSMMKAGRDALVHLHTQGETASRADHIVSWNERQSLFNLDDFDAAQAFYDHPENR